MAPKKGIRFFTFSNLICFRITESRPKKTDRYRRSLSDVHHVSGAKTQTQIDWHNGTRTQVPIGNPYRFFFHERRLLLPRENFAWLLETCCAAAGRSDGWGNLYAYNTSVMSQWKTGEGAWNFPYYWKIVWYCLIRNTDIMLQQEKEGGSLQ